MVNHTKVFNHDDLICLKEKSQTFLLLGLALTCLRTELVAKFARCEGVRTYSPSLLPQVPLHKRNRMHLELKMA